MTRGWPVMSLAKSKCTGGEGRAALDRAGWRCLEGKQLRAPRKTVSTQDHQNPVLKGWTQEGKALKETEEPSVPSRFSRVRLFVTPWTIAHQAPLSLGFSRQEHRSGLPCPSSPALSNPEIELASLMCPASAGELFTTSAWWAAVCRVAQSRT